MSCKRTLKGLDTWNIQKQKEGTTEIRDIKNVYGMYAVEQVILVLVYGGQNVIGDGMHFVFCGAIEYAVVLV